jgi:6-phosphogluconolactonase
MMEYAFPPARMMASPPALALFRGTQQVYGRSHVMPGNPQSIELFLGCYDYHGKSGLVSLSRGPSEDGWRLGVADTSIPNASYAAFSAKHNLHFILNEQKQGQIGAYRHRMGKWVQAQDISSEGAGPCFIALRPDATALAVANYDNGSVAVFDVSPCGILSGPKLVHQNWGQGPNAIRQDGPHAHCVQFYGDRLYSADLGTDEILMHTFGATSETIVACRLPAGEGPRHMLFHRDKPLAYVLTELGNRLFMLAVQDNGRLRELHHISTLPEGFGLQSTAAHLALNALGTKLYVSNRGDDSIVVFDLDAEGFPVFRCRAPTGAKGPRHFHLLESARQIVVAHQEGGQVTVLEMGQDGSPGRLVWSAEMPQAAFVGEIGAD